VYRFKRLATGKQADADPGLYRSKPETIDDIVLLGRTFLEEKYVHVGLILLSMRSTLDYGHEDEESVSSTLWDDRASWCQIAMNRF
jgi:hypothetical protein